MSDCSRIADHASRIKKAVVLLSGGIDSSTAAAIAKSEGYEIHALSFDYGQRHGRELESARMVAASLGIGNHIVIKFDLREIGGSALTADIEVPKDRDALSMTGDEQEDEHAPRIAHHASRIPVTYVPARNTIFLSFALGLAEVSGAEDIFIGANAVDYSGYPDCRPEYLKAFEEMANLATKAAVEGDLRFRIRAPLLDLTKGEIIKKGTELGLDYSLTWSCYDPQKGSDGLSVMRDEKESRHASPASPAGGRVTHHDPVPCGRCDSCLFREKGFREAGVPDPLYPKA